MLEIGRLGALIWTNENLQFHREKGPAMIYPSGYMEFVFAGRRHRLDGPARIHASGIKKYYIYGVFYTKEAYYAKVRKL